MIEEGVLETVAPYEVRRKIYDRERRNLILRGILFGILCPAVYLYIAASVDALRDPSENKILVFWLPGISMLLVFLYYRALYKAYCYGLEPWEDTCKAMKDPTIKRKTPPSRFLCHVILQSQFYFVFFAAIFAFIFASDYWFHKIGTKGEIELIDTTTFFEETLPMGLFLIFFALPYAYEGRRFINLEHKDLWGDIMIPPNLESIYSCDFIDEKRSAIKIPLILFLSFGAYYLNNRFCILLGSFKDEYDAMLYGVVLLFLLFVTPFVIAFGLYSVWESNFGPLNKLGKVLFGSFYD